MNLAKSADLSSGFSFGNSVNIGKSILLQLLVSAPGLYSTVFAASQIQALFVLSSVNFAPSISAFCLAIWLCVNLLLHLWHQSNIHHYRLFVNFSTNDTRKIFKSRLRSLQIEKHWLAGLVKTCASGPLLLDLNVPMK